MYLKLPCAPPLSDPHLPSRGHHSPIVLLVYKYLIASLYIYVQASDIPCLLLDCKLYKYVVFCDFISHSTCVSSRVFASGWKSLIFH